MAKKQDAVKWNNAPDPDDYEAAENFLQLLYDPKKARQLAKKLRRAKLSSYAAKDILRASGTSLPEIEAFDWRKQQKKIGKGDPLSPIMLVRQQDGGPLIVADGFHRMCAVFSADEEVIVPCKIV